MKRSTIKKIPHFRGLYKLKHPTIKARPHFKGNLNHRQTLEHIFWIKACKLSYTQVIDMVRWSNRVANVFSN